MDRPLVKSKNVVSEILKLLPELGKALATSVPDRVRHQGISNAQVRAVVHLAEYGPQTMGELAQGLRITTPSTTGLINPLVDMDLVQRERDDEDRRVVRVRLTQKAQTMAGHVLAQRRREVERALDGMDEEARVHFLEGLQRLACAYDTDESQDVAGGNGGHS